MRRTARYVVPAGRKNKYRGGAAARFDIRMKFYDKHPKSVKCSAAGESQLTLSISVTGLLLIPIELATLHVVVHTADYQDLSLPLKTPGDDPMIRAEGATPAAGDQKGH